MADCVVGTGHALKVLCLFLIRLVAAYADAFEHRRPQLAHLRVTAFDGGVDGVADRQQLGALEEQYLRLHQAAALELDPSQRDHEGVLRRGFEREQRRWPYRRVQRVSERRDIDQQGLESIQGRRLRVSAATRSPMTGSGSGEFGIGHP